MLVVGLGSNMLLARLLTPEQIGLYSVSLAVVSVAQVLRDFGVVSYLIQEADLRAEYVGTAFGISLILGVALFAAVFFSAPWLAAAYDSAAMTPILQVCALNFLALPFCTVSLALLRREMAFKALAAVNLVAAFSGAVISVALAWFGFGVMSLAIGALSVNVLTGLGAWWVRREAPLIKPTLTAWRRVMAFGAQSSITGVVTSVSMDINDLAVGKLMGFTPVALLSRAQGLMNMFHRDLMAAIRNVAYPAYAQAHRERRPLEPLCVQSVGNVVAVAWPFYGFASLFALEALRLLFGPQWDAAAPLVPWFCLAGALAAAGSLVGNLILAVGRVDLVTRMELLFQPFRAALIVVAALVFRTEMACALALVVALGLQLPLLYAVKAKCLPNDWSALAQALGRSGLVATVALAGPAVVSLAAGWGRSAPMHWGWFLASAGLCMLSWVLALRWLHHPLAKEAAFQRAWQRAFGWLDRAGQR